MAGHLCLNAHSDANGVSQPPMSSRKAMGMPLVLNGVSGCLRLSTPVRLGRCIPSVMAAVAGKVIARDRHQNVRPRFPPSYLVAASSLVTPSPSLSMPIFVART